MTALEEIKKSLEVMSLEKWATYQGLRGTAIVVADGDGVVKRYSDDGKVFEIPTGMPENARYIAAVNPAAISELVSTLESLQRENEEFRQDRYDLAYAITGGEDAPGLLDSVPASHLVEIARDTHHRHRADLERAMEAEAKVEHLSKSLLSEETVEVVAEAIWSIRRVEEDRCDMSLEDIGGQESSVWQEAKLALQALASTGGEHHADK